MGKDFRVILDKDSSRAETFMRVFGRLEVCVVSPFPHWANLPGFDEPQLVHSLDLDELTPAEHAALVTDIHDRFNIPEDEVKALVAARGVPILASECTVLVDNPQRWLRLI